MLNTSPTLFVVQIGNAALDTDYLHEQKRLT